MRRILWSGVFSLTSAVVALPAAAGPVSIDDVRNMASAKGIVEIEEVALDHHGVWKVEGEDAGGHEIKMKVDAASGAIIKLKRDD